MRVLPIIIAFLIASNLNSQNKPVKIISDGDTLYVYESPPDFKLPDTVKFKNSWGLDLSVSTKGFGLGVFLRRKLNETTFLYSTLGFLTAKDEGEVEYIDPWTGQTFIPGKVNRIMVFPVSFAFQFRLFKGELVENVRPFVIAGVGPAFIFTTPYRMEFFSSLKYGRLYYTFNLFLGFGAYIGLDPNTITGVSVRYYLIPYPRGIESLKGRPLREFGGPGVALSFGTNF